MRPYLVGNIIDGAIDIYNASRVVGIPIRDEKAVAAGEALTTLVDRHSLDDTVVSAILLLWHDPDFREIWENRSHFQLQDTWHEFANALEDYPTWGGPSWVPTTDEILRCRVRTTGMVDEQFVVRNNKLRMLDVGGQQSERRKWIHYFADVTSVIFVTSLSEYDQLLFEDNKSNRLAESLSLFNTTVNDVWFEKVAIIVFLNKSDLFYEKYVVKKVPLNISGLFPDAPSGEPDLTKAYGWFQEKFKAQRNDPSRTIYSHVTCATDTQAIDAVMKASSQHILKQNLKDSGVLV